MPIASAFRLLARRLGNQKRFWRGPVKRAGRLRQRHGLIVKGKRISCPPPQHLLVRVALPVQEYDYEHGFPLIRSLRASTQRSTSVLFSFVLSLLIVAGSFAIWEAESFFDSDRAVVFRSGCAALRPIARRGRDDDLLRQVV